MRHGAMSVIRSVKPRLLLLTACGLLVYCLLFGSDGIGGGGGGGAGSPGGGGGGSGPCALLASGLPEMAPWVRTLPIPDLDEGGCPPSGRLLSINSAGRLGNVMSEYATLLGASQKLCRPAWLLPEMAQTLADYFEPPSTPVLPRDCRLNWTRTPIEQLIKDRPAGDEDHLITGWPHAVPLFHPLREQLLREFTFRPELRVRAAAHLANLARRANLSEPTFIGVHVRRTDYGTWLEQRVGGHLIGVNYLERAVALMRRRHARALFVVTSDDLAWCRRELRFINVYVVKNDDNGQPGADLALLTACNHTVVTHGTFGFWAAYLAGGEVVAPTGYGQRPTGLEEDVKSAGLNWTWLDAFVYSSSKFRS